MENMLSKGGQTELYAGEIPILLGSAVHFLLLGYTSISFCLLAVLPTYIPVGYLLFFRDASSRFARQVFFGSEASTNPNLWFGLVVALWSSIKKSLEATT